MGCLMHGRHLQQSLTTDAAGVEMVSTCCTPVLQKQVTTRGEEVKDAKSGKYPSTSMLVG